MYCHRKYKEKRVPTRTAHASVLTYVHSVTWLVMLKHTHKCGYMRTNIDYRTIRLMCVESVCLCKKTKTNKITEKWERKTFYSLSSSEAIARSWSANSANNGLHSYAIYHSSALNPLMNRRSLLLLIVVVDGRRCCWSLLLLIGNQWFRCHCIYGCITRYKMIVIDNTKITHGLR